MEERNIDTAEEAVESVTTSQATQDTDTPLDKNVRLMSPTQMVLRRFFRSKLSIIGLIMVIGLFLFSFLGPVFYTQWGETEPDATGKINYTQTTVTYTDADGNEYSIKQTIQTNLRYNTLAPSSTPEIITWVLNQGRDILQKIFQ